MLKSFGLTGRSDNKVDSKGRIAIPSQMRKILAPKDSDEVVVSLGREGQLALFNKEYWGGTIQQNMMDRLDKASGPKDWTAIQREIHRLSENSHMSSVDGQGRITIPQWLLDKAALDRDAVVIGAVDRVCVWSPKRYGEWIEKEEGEDSSAGIYI